jgi:hypothetical protein
MDAISTGRVLLGTWLDIRKLMYRKGDWTRAWLGLKAGGSLPACGTMPTEVQSEAVKLPGNRLAHALRYPGPTQLRRQRLEPGGSAPFAASPRTPIRG